MNALPPAREMRVAAIMVAERLRALRDPLVAELMESMHGVGLIHPISITYPNGQATPVLVAGAHRLAAAKQLQWETIACVVVAYTSDDEARLMEIDENLVRGELTPAERALHIAERKAVYERLHPETKQGGAPGAGRGKAHKEAGPAAFSADTAAKSGRSARSVRKDTMRAKRIPALADCIGTSLDRPEELDALGELPEEEQAPLIARAKAGEKVTARHRLKQRRRAQREEALAQATAAASQALGEQLYALIYADPPWRFEPWSRATGMNRAPENHYPTMDLAEIKALQVPAADNAVLFLWATVPMLPQALEVMAAWGFAYRSHIVWMKNRQGSGYWVRNCHELLLIGVRGDVPAPAAGEQYRSVVEAKVGAHSAKPACFAEMIEDMFPHQRGLEMFARGPRLGWDVWGNQA